jgi:hypothetical protein
MVTGGGDGRHDGPAIAARMAKQRSARRSGRFHSDGSGSNTLGEADPITTARRARLSEREHRQSRLFPKHRYHEPLLHNTSRGVLLSL